MKNLITFFVMILLVSTSISCSKHSQIKPLNSGTNFSSIQSKKKSRQITGNDLRAEYYSSPLTKDTTDPNGSYLGDFDGVEYRVNVQGIPNMYCDGSSFPANVIGIISTNSPYTVLQTQNYVTVIMLASNYINLEDYHIEVNSFISAADSSGQGLRSFPIWTDYVKNDFTSSPNSIIYNFKFITRTSYSLAQDTFYMADPNYVPQKCNLLPN